MSANGKIDVYLKDSTPGMHTENDLNITADRDTPITGRTQN